MSSNNKYVKSPLNYVGGKFKLLKEIIPIFPDKISTFVDLFGGSGSVILNAKAEHYIYNDINNYVADIFEGIATEDVEEIINNIDYGICEYNLTKTNKDGFERLRSDYNNGMNNWKVLYTLMCYSFNYQFRFNTNHKYNSSFGKDRSSFSNNQRNNLIYANERLKNMDLSFSRVNFKDFDFSDFDENDFIYLDPPYLKSVGNYNDGKRGFDGWTEENEKQLLNILDELNDRGIKFALSNNLKYDNPLLDEWKDKYIVHYLNGDYSNCNYHKIDRSKDCEVLITNY